MVPEFDAEEACRRRLHEWLFLLLRFAITRDLSDRSAAMAMADELDSLGVRWRPAGPLFFRQTSREVCDAILTSGDAGSESCVKRLLQQGQSLLEHFLVDRQRRQQPDHVAVHPAGEQ